MPLAPLEKWGGLECHWFEEIWERDLSLMLKAGDIPLPFRKAELDRASATEVAFSCVDTASPESSRLEKGEKMREKERGRALSGAE